MIPIFIEYLDTGLVPKFPTLIGAGFIMLTSILFVMCGLILEVIVKKDKQHYELLMNLMKKQEKK